MIYKKLFIAFIGSAISLTAYGDFNQTGKTASRTKSPDSSLWRNTVGARTRSNDSFTGTGPFNHVTFQVSPNEEGATGTVQGKNRGYATFTYEDASGSGTLTGSNGGTADFSLNHSGRDNSLSIYNTPHGNTLYLQESSPGVYDLDINGANGGTISGTYNPQGTSSFTMQGANYDGTNAGTGSGTGYVDVSSNHRMPQSITIEGPWGRTIEGNVDGTGYGSNYTMSYYAPGSTTPTFTGEGKTQIPGEPRQYTHYYNAAGDEIADRFYRSTVGGNRYIETYNPNTGNAVITRYDPRTNTVTYTNPSSNQSATRTVNDGVVTYTGPQGYSAVRSYSPTTGITFTGGPDNGQIQLYEGQLYYNGEAIYHNNASGGFIYSDGSPVQFGFMGQG